MKLFPAMRGEKSCFAAAVVLALLCATVSTDYSADYPTAVEDNLDTIVLLDSELNDIPPRAPCKNNYDCLGIEKVQCELDPVENKKFCKCGNDSMWFSPELRRCLVPCRNDADCGEHDNVHCTLYPERRSSFCKCDSDSFYYWSRIGTCLDCDCGVNGNCSYYPGPFRMCSCDEAYSEKNNTCQVCDCGENGSCMFDLQGERMCHCNDRYKLNGTDGNCEACYCGINGFCRFENGTKVCYCGGGEKEFEGECKYCDCGLSIDCKFNSTGGAVCSKCFPGAALRFGKCASCRDCDNQTYDIPCTFDEKGDRICICPKLRANDKGICRDCACGPKSEGCDFVGNTKRCQCQSGSKEENGYCKESHTYRTVGIVVGVLGGVAAAGAIIFYLYKKHRKT